LAFPAADEAFDEAIALLPGHPGLWLEVQPVKTESD
jgi:hypothetical protein